MKKKTLRELPDAMLRTKRILVRLDLNVPIDESNHVTDDTRIRASIPTLLYLLKRGGRPVVLSHFGRPKGKPDVRYSLQPVAEKIGLQLKFKDVVTSNQNRKVLVILDNLDRSTGDTAVEALADAMRAVPQRSG